MVATSKFPDLKNLDIFNRFLVIHTDKLSPKQAVRWAMGYFYLYGSLPLLFFSLTFQYLCLALEPHMPHDLQILLLCLVYLKKT